MNGRSATGATSAAAASTGRARCETRRRVSIWRTAACSCIDANGDGRTDLLVVSRQRPGYFPLQLRRRCGTGARSSATARRRASTWKIPRSGWWISTATASPTRSARAAAWSASSTIRRRAGTIRAGSSAEALEDFPNVNFSDPRVKWADMTGDGLQDIVLVHDGNVEYWPNLGPRQLGQAGLHAQQPALARTATTRRRILLGDVDGDGLADLVYVDDATGHALDQSERQRAGATRSRSAARRRSPTWTPCGWPTCSAPASAGVLWSADADGLSRASMFFLDFTGGMKPYLLDEMDNHMGAVTRSSTRPRRSSTWRTSSAPRPAGRRRCRSRSRWWPVSRSSTHISGGKLTTEYRYHHGYWDGAEREFRGFGRGRAARHRDLRGLQRPRLARPRRAFDA